jgi:hypothetical protein
MRSRGCHPERSRVVIPSAVEGQKNKTMKFYYVYILKCSDNSLYTGITNDLE